MKFFKNKAFIILWVIAIAVGSCAKDLDLTPRGEISDATFWNTKNDFELAANAFYQFLDGPGYDDNWADIGYGWQPNSISNGTYVVPENSAVWNKSYQQIRAANKVIAQAEESDLGNHINQYLGEAKFFRAFYYYKIYRLYGGVPLIKKVLNTSDEELYSPRSTREETVKYILNDLTEAASLLSEKGSVTTGRVTKGAALALKARVALFEGTWRKFHNDGQANEMLDQAIAASDDVIKSGKYSLFTGKGDQSYRYLFIEEGDDSNESIFDRRYHRDVAVTDFGWWIAYETSSPTKKLADMYLCTDGLPIEKSGLFKGYDTFVSEYENRDSRMSQTFIKPGLATVRPHFARTPVANWPNRNPNVGYMLYKFLSEDVTGNSVWGQHQFDWRIIRYAEVLLTYAEAVFEKNNSISDADLNKSINLLRARVNMPPITNSFLAENGMDMRTEIRRERTVELAFEMFRYDDLRRWKIAEIELPKDVKGIKNVGTEWSTLPAWAAGSRPNDAQGFVIAEGAANRKFEVPKHYWQPLPSKQISLYPDILSQNPGWQ